jgi:hypothetical protein
MVLRFTVYSSRFRGSLRGRSPWQSDAVIASVPSETREQRGNPTLSLRGVAEAISLFHWDCFPRIKYVVAMTKGLNFEPLLSQGQARNLIFIMLISFPIVN